nr:MAG TPA: hypothetical protein [Caudoviricetes sp.]
MSGRLWRAVQAAARSIREADASSGRVGRGERREAVICSAQAPAPMASESGTSGCRAAGSRGAAAAIRYEVSSSASVRGHVSQERRGGGVWSVMGRMVRQRTDGRRAMPLWAAGRGRDVGGRVK